VVTFSPVDILILDVTGLKAIVKGPLIFLMTLNQSGSERMVRKVDSLVEMLELISFPETSQPTDQHAY
jgi:hypothetical protein